jgi:hypothetical protein
MLIAQNATRGSSFWNRLTLVFVSLILVVFCSDLLIPEIEKCHMPSHYHPHAFFNMPTTTRPGLVLLFLVPNQLTTTPKNLTNFANPKSIGNSPKNSANFFLKVLHHPT